MNTSAIHLIEQGGRGGVFQHTAQVASELAQSGRQVVIHTASDHETVDLPSGIGFCRCISWMRHVQARHIRLPLVFWRYLLVTLPHLARATRGSVVHVQGQFGSGLYAPTVVLISKLASWCVWSPHNTFSRHGRRLEARLLRLSVRHADLCVCFSGADEERLTALGAVRVARMPLVQYLPIPSPKLVDSWRGRFGSDGKAKPLVLLPGQVRKDKGVSDFVAAASLCSSDAVFVIAGADAGYAQHAADEVASTNGLVHLHVAFLELEEFTALVKAADLVVAPYRRASSSGVLAVAMQLGVQTVAYPVGGLVESGARLASDTTPKALAEAIDSALSELGDQQTVAEVGVVQTSHPWICKLYERTDTT